MKKAAVLFLALLMAVVQSVYGQEKEKAKEKKKDGWTFGAFPSIGYDSNVGLKIGGIVKLFDYGDGSSYPRYDQSLHFELSRSTKGQGINQFIYDTRKLIPGIRLMAEASYLTEKVLDFYGFNGYNAYYDPGYTTSGDPLYLSTVFYRMDRALFKTKLELIGRLKGENLKWFGGFEYLNNNLDTVDINNLNKGRDEDDYLPPVGGGLYGNFIEWELIPRDQANGGQTGIFKLGAKYDTRDNEANPMKGIWTEIMLMYSPGFISDGYNYSRFAFTHRQYFTLIPKRVNFGYRISYQAKLSGEMPFYMLPLVYNSAPQVTLSGLGGGKTMRGILRNRVVGEDFIYANAEIRWKIFRAIILNQNIYVALAGFVDGGMITGKYKLPETTNAEATAWLAKGEKEELHISYGGGAHFALNDNFVVTMDYGWADDPRDGTRGTYIGMGFLF
jgi:outer membrane protein assembly factor BamA